MNFIIIFSLHIVSLLTVATVPIFHSSCKYAVLIPEGWDKIPVDTIKNKLNGVIFDLGIYPSSQDGFFNGNYVLINFMPSQNTLTGFTFEQIEKDILNLNKQGEIKNDSLQVHFEKISPDIQNTCIHSYFSLVKNAVSVENCQTLYLSKFGYISVMSYKKAAEGMSMNEIQKQLTNLIRIEPDYQYHEPKKSGISMKHIAISIITGVFVYGFIIFFSKKRVEK